MKYTERKKLQKMYYCPKREALVGILDTKNKNNIEIILKCKNNNYSVETLKKAAEVYNLSKKS